MKPDETCGRCGHGKAEHAQVRAGGAMLLICPTALFLKDDLQALIDDEKAS